jgi:hypothetical protein
MLVTGLPIPTVRESDGRRLIDAYRLGNEEEGYIYVS